jgi:hypothetical protein
MVRATEKKAKKEWLMLAIMEMEIFRKRVLELYAEQSSLMLPVAPPSSHLGSSASQTILISSSDCCSSSVCQYTFGLCRIAPSSSTCN